MAVSRDGSLTVQFDNMEIVWANDSPNYHAPEGLVILKVRQPSSNEFSLDVRLTIDEALALRSELENAVRWVEKNFCLVNR